jgi:hypothetical protein
MRNNIFVAILGIGALAGSFLLTLWLTAPAMRPANEAEPRNLAAATLAAYLVPDERILAAAATSAGLQPSDKQRGFVDEISRTNKERVTIRGWAADLVGNGEPLTVLVFADGKNTAEIQTKGPRPDVVQALKLSEAAAANVAFEGELFCNPGKALVVVAVTKNNSYAPINQAARPLLCP